MRAFYNDHDPWCVRHLIALVDRGLLPGGPVTSHEVEDLQALRVDRYEQVHLFAGIGGWPYALRLAGWPEDRPVWTGSCPCQPFSSAGKRKGTDDRRHLWPEMLRLITECRPPTIFGEQVASPLGRRWLAGVRADLETLGYAVGAADLPAACVGAPHLRQRLFWVADAGEARRGGRGAGEEGGENERVGRLAKGRGLGRLGDGHRGRHQKFPKPERRAERPQQSTPRRADVVRSGAAGFWGDFDLCHFTGPDAGKVRRIEPGTFPVADGVPGRVAPLRGLGNAIVPQVAAVFVKAFELGLVGDTGEANE